MTDSAAVDGLAAMIQKHVAGGGSVAGAVRELSAYVPKELLDAARKQYEKSVGLIKELKDPNVLVEREVLEGFWYGGPKDDDVFWPALRSKLAPHLPDEALRNVGDSSSKVVGLMRPPGASSIRTRGLVLGHVQSGKTTSFMSVAAKAADVGYRMVIVLSGITDNLRSQTQIRLEQQLVGDLDKKWLLLTDQDHDFQKTGNAAAFMTSPQHRLLAVVKKNPYRLRRLAEWLESGGEAALRACPILLVDDEADQASIDVGKRRLSTINALIRRLLENPKAAYVAYTATPFANLLIDPAAEEGLYPRDFIVDLPAGDGYYGPERLFGRDLLDHVEDDASAEPDDVVREVPLEDIPEVQPPKGKGAVHTWTPSMSPSLQRAIDWFLLATSARWARGHRTAHSSMLIHTSMLADAHFRLHEVVSTYCEALEDRLLDGDRDSTDELRGIWEEEYGRVQRRANEADVDFDSVMSELPHVLADLRVIVDNYKSTARLEYRDNEPLTCIAIGGNTLSRGLTLEGLISSYFVRAASAYDTLLQMGRWFGYRRGYSDLVRIWMTDELCDWFRDLATVEAEIRREIARYEAESLRPAQLAVKIRTHPAMAITSASKMRAAVQASLDYSGKREQTILFRHRDQEWLGANWTAGETLLERASDSPGVEAAWVESSGRYVLRDVPVAVIQEFIEAYDFHPDAVRLSGSLLSRYVSQERKAGGLLTWNVVVMSNEKNTVGTRKFGPAGEINLIRRTRMKPAKQETANIKALAGSTDRAADLGASFLATVSGDSSDAEILAKRQSISAGPLLALYPIARSAEVPSGTRARVPLDAVDDVLGVTLFFPKAVGAGSSITYMAADLSSVEVEEIELDPDALDKDDEAAAEATADVESGEDLP